ncbi:MAG TPA: hypothetical protein VGD77_05495 [Gemmatimonadaceae bacterium]
MLAAGVGLAVAASMAQAAPIQGAAPGAAQATGRISGVAWDSLARRPLARAAIWTSSGNRAVIADSTGRFTLDSLPPGEHELVVLDSALDAVGLDITRRVVIADRPDAGARSIVLATPSLRTLRTRLCDAESGLTRAGDRSSSGGILFGIVIEPTGGRRVAGAVVEVAWPRVEILAGRPVPLTATAHVRTDGMGEYAACDLPIDTLLAVSALGGPFGRATGAPVALGAHRLGRLDLTLGAATQARDSMPH